MEIYLLQEIIIILAISTIVVLICQKIKVPSIIGFLLTGALAGPHGLGLIHSAHEVEMIAEIGVIFLLFTIGIEFSFEHLFAIKRSVLLGGGVQVVFTLLLTMVCTMLLGQSAPVGIFAGCLVALSSTAIVLKLLQQRQEMDSPQGKIVLGILIFQDLAIVPMMLLAPLLAGKADNVALELGLMVLKFIGVGLGVAVASKWLMPRLLYQVVRTRNNELFLLATLAICLLVAWLTSSIGLSLSLGAFLAGLIISESEYSHQAMSNILPFRDIFISFFFVSVGMLLNSRLFMEQGFVIVGLTLGVILIKVIGSMIAAAALKSPIRISLLTGLALAQVGEFAFVLSKTGLSYGLLQEKTYQLFLAVSLLTMALTPLLIAIGPRTTVLMNKLPIARRFGTGRLEPPAQAEGIKNHLIIIGFGLNGQNLARAARMGGIPYLIAETNAETVKQYHDKEPIMYGDATQSVILEHLHIKEARVAVIAISDPLATQQMIRSIRRLNSKIYLIVRTRFVKEVTLLYRLGADAVVPEEFETSIEIFTHVLERYLVPRADIESLVDEVRSDGYSVLRAGPGHPRELRDLPLSELEVSSIRLDESSELINQSLLESDLRRRFGTTLLAIRRNNELIANPDAEVRFQPQDVLVLMGQPEAVTSVASLCQTPGQEGASEEPNS